MQYLDGFEVMWLLLIDKLLLLLLLLFVVEMLLLLWVVELLLLLLLLVLNMSKCETDDLARMCSRKLGIDCEECKC